jgi:hypothetical protein
MLRPTGRSGLTLQVLSEAMVVLVTGESGVIGLPTAYTGAGKL